MRVRLRDRFELPWVLATLAVGLTLGGLLIGYEPVGGDPDRIFRPIKSELSRALQQGHLPFWSDRFGLGVPLVAESLVAAFYPLNPIFYRLLDVSTAYRWAMWLHFLALVAATYVYARVVGLAPWGSGMTSLSFTLCGFEEIHSSHEPFYYAMPYLPLALILAERWLATGGLGWLAGLALALGVQLTIGHFQSQALTWGLVLITGLWRVLVDRRPPARGIALLVGVAWGAAVAAVQLGLSWELAQAVGQTSRSPADLSYYSFPPAHWIELALPRFFRGLHGGAEGPYWHGQATTGFEVSLYVGTVPLILAIVGFLNVGRNRAVSLWRLVVPLSFAVATMPRWWPSGYHAILQVPGLGYFRVPARYTLLTSFGLAVLAGQGFDRAVSARTFRAGVLLAVAFAAAAVSWGLVCSQRSDFRSLSDVAGLPFGLASAAVAWSVGLAAVLAWRGRVVGPWAPFLVTAVELGVLYHRGTTQWGWAVELPHASPVLSELARKEDVRRVAGVLGDLPVRAGLATAAPYLGFTLGPPHPLLKAAQDRLGSGRADPVAVRWLRRFGVTHGVWEAPIATGHGGELLETRTDAALDLLVYRPPPASARRLWRVVRYDDAFPDARVALHAHVVSDRRTIVERLSLADARDEACYLAEDHGAGGAGPGPRARSARVLRWDGRSGAVEHDGPCDLILTRAFDPGWRARVGDGPERPVLRVDDGLQAIPLAGSGVTAVVVRYESPLLRPLAAVSAAATGAALLALAGAGVARFPLTDRAGRAPAESRPSTG